MRFRDFELSFRRTEVEEINKNVTQFTYPQMVKKFCKNNSSESCFTLEIESGSFNTSEIILLMGENGGGKTTFIKILAGLEQIDNVELPRLNVSYKPQFISTEIYRYGS